LIQTVIEEQIKKNQSMKVEAPLEKLMKKRESRKMRKYYQLKDPSKEKEQDKSPEDKDTAINNQSSTNERKNEAMDKKDEQKAEHKKDKERREKSDSHSKRNTLDTTTKAKEK
jgi:hypothetical protein